MQGAPKTPKRPPAGMIDIASDLLDDPELAYLMGPPVEPDDGGDETDEDEEVAQRKGEE